ncbi:MAG: peptidylprolyl isomerase [Kiritimatiellae bacterium]|nr:peptidylprolyl isomerase [Kiritimatiellia bacterium]
MKKFWMSLAAAALAMGCDSKQAGAVSGADVQAAMDETIAALQEPSMPSVVATVNGVDIPAEKVEHELDLFMKQMGAGAGAEQMAAILPRIRARVIDNLIEKQILLSAADAEGVDLTDEELSEVLGQLGEELPEGVTVEEFLAETGMQMEEVREQMRLRKLLMEKAAEAGEPSEEEVRAFYDENQDAMKVEESVRASHILVSVGKDEDDESKAAKRAKIEALRERALAGEDFAELAKENSDCPSKANGGDLRDFGRGMMVPEFEEAAFTQEVGKVGDVVETQFGYHIILVTERQDAKVMEFDEVKDRIAQMLKAQKQQDAVMKYVEGLDAAAEVVRYDQAGVEDETFAGMDEEELGLELVDDEEDAAGEGASDDAAPAAGEPAPEEPAEEAPAAE